MYWINFFSATQNCLRNSQFHFLYYIIFFSFIYLVLLYLYFYKQIPGTTLILPAIPFSLHSQHLSIHWIHRNINFFSRFYFLISLAWAFFTFKSYNLPISIAIITNNLLATKTLHDRYIATASACKTACWNAVYEFYAIFFTWFASGSVTSRTNFVSFDLYFFSNFLQTIKKINLNIYEYRL